MDCSKKYIKMCEKAEEIQELRRGFSSGYIGEIWHIQNRFQIYQGKVYVGGLWLPRQDQLQEMVYSLPENGKHKQSPYNEISYAACPNVICQELLEFSEDDCKMGLESMEQLWLAFVMQEKYGKVWDNEKEEWV